jgi:hypothetical protein
MSETRIVYLGTVTVEDDKTVAFDIPLDASPDEIAAAIERAAAEKAAAQVRETEQLRKLFLGEGHTDE